MQVSNQLYAPFLSFQVLEAINTLYFEPTTREITVSRVVNQLLQKFDLLHLEHTRKKQLTERVLNALPVLQLTKQIKVEYKLKLPHRTNYIVIILIPQKIKNA